jgi:hypothetical protein
MIKFRMQGSFQSRPWHKLLKLRRRDSLVRQYRKQQTQRYWKWRQWKQRLRFWFANRVFQTRIWKQSQRDELSIFGILVRSILPKVILAVVLVAGLEVVEYLFGLGQFATWSLLNANAYLELATAIVGLTGAFLALYFTAVTVVASTVYADVSDDVRRLLVEEKFGNLYFRVVALLGVIAVLVTGLLVLSYVPGILNLIMILFLSAFSIFSFVRLGIRTLEFFNPVPLLAYLDRDFVRWSRSATTNGLMWHDQSFQYHYQQQAEKALKTYRNMMGLITAKKGMGVAPIFKTAHHTLMLLETYAYLKLQVPTESYWFRRMGEFQDWLLADHFEVKLALSTNTDIQQKAVPNLLWVEEELCNVIRGGIAEFVERKDWQNTIETLNQWQSSLGVISMRWGIDEALYLFSDLELLMKTKVVRADETWNADQTDYKELEMRLAVIDFYQLAFIQIVLGFAKKVDSLTPEEFGKRIAQINWTKNKDIYETGLPREVISQLEYLQENLEFEFAVEGKVVSPEWYWHQLIATEFAKYAVKIVERFIHQLESLFVTEAENLIKAKSSIFAAQTCERGMEAIAKAHLCLSNTQECLEQLSIYRKTFGFHLINIKWPDVNWLELNQQLAGFHDHLLVLQGKAVPTLMGLPKSKHLPDMFGQAYTSLAIGCFNAMMNGKTEIFRELFRAFFIAGFVANQRLTEQLQDREDWIRLNLSIDPIIDVAEISGYAIVYTELGIGNYWETVKHNWDWYFSKPETKKTRLEMIEAFVNYKDSQFGAGQRVLIRTNWKQAFGRQMRSMGIKDDLDNRHFGYESQLEKYPPIIQTVIGHGISSIPLYDFCEVFLAIYFNQGSPAPEFKLPRRAAEFRKSLRRRQQFQEESRPDE